VVNDLVLSQEDTLETHRTVREISHMQKHARNLNISVSRGSAATHFRFGG